MKTYNSYFILFCLLYFILSPFSLYSAGPGSVIKANMFMQALINKDYNLATALIKEEPELLYTPNDETLTPLGLAVKNDDLALFKYLIDAGAPISSPYYDKPLLITALYTNSTKTMVALLELGGDAQVLYHSLSPLHIAVLLGRIDFIKILLEYESDPDQTDSKGLTPFAMAALRKQWDIVNLLAPKTKNINTPDTYNMTPMLYFLTEEPNYFKNFIQALGEIKMADLNFHTKKVPPVLITAVEKNNIDALEYLLKMGANVNIQDTVNKNTPLMVAVENKNEKAIKLLLSYNPNIKLRNKKKKTAINLTSDEDLKLLLSDYSK